MYVYLKYFFFKYLVYKKGNVNKFVFLYSVIKISILYNFKKKSVSGFF